MKAWQKNVRTVEPYVPGEQPVGEGIIKLNTNENPYPPAPGVLKVHEHLDNLRLYPDPKVELLVEALAKYHKMDKEQVFVGVGSDDVLSMAFLTFFNGDKAILFPDITYSFYDVWAELYRIPYKTQPLDENFQMKKEDYLQENGGIIFPNPNAPTGVLESVDFIEDIVKNNPESVVIVDEAYIDFGGTTVLPLIEKYDNLLVVRTYSKSRSLAGLRVGYAMGSPELIKAMQDVKYSFNSYTMNRPSILLGVASLEDEEYFQATLKKVMDTREWFSKEMKKMEFEFPKSYTNFIFAKHNRVPARYLFEEAKKQNVYVRYFDKPIVNNYLRISIGTDEEMKKLLSVFQTLIDRYHE